MVSPRLLPARTARHAASVAQVGDHHPPRRGDGVELLQGEADVLERQPMKAVTEHACVPIFAGQRVHIGNQGGGPVERRVEARHLSQPGTEPWPGADGGEVVGLVGRGERLEAGQGFERPFIDHDRLGVDRPSVDNAVADPHNLEARTVWDSSQE